MGSSHRPRGRSTGLYADNFLALPALISFFPLRIDIGSIKEISALFYIRVEYFEGLFLIGTPTKDVPTETERRYGEQSLRNSNHWLTVRQNEPVRETGSEVK